jgi:hypothetical protein
MSLQNHFWGHIIYELRFKSVVIHKSYNHFISQDICKRDWRESIKRLFNIHWEI